MFITNIHQHYFEVLCDINPRNLVGCMIHATEREMLEYLASACSIDIGELEGNTIQIEAGPTGYVESNFSGLWIDIELADGESLEDYLSEYVC